jgi:rRNA maturation protein Rpf1
MIEPIITEWKFEYKHTNHSVFRGVIKATSILNRDTQALSLLFSRYRRKIGLENVKFEEVV